MINYFVKEKWMYLLLIIITTNTLSCNTKENVDPLRISVTPDYLVMESRGGVSIPFTINCSGPRTLQKFKIEVQDNTTKTTILDSTLSWGKSFALTYYHQIPKKSNRYSLVFFFHVLDSDGNISSASRTINVSASSIPATEISGVQIYTKETGNADAYDLLNFQSLMSALDPSSSQDIVDVPNSSDATIVSRSWTSSSGAKFLVFNAFDYANATQESIQNTYLSGSPQSQINNLLAGSIILMETNRNNVKRYYAIQMVSINDDGLGNNDFYLFNVKY